MSFDSVSEEEEVPHEAPVGRPPFPLYTWILLASIAALFLAHIAAGVEIPAEGTSFDKQKFLSGQYYRILTGTTVHGGLLHVAMNGFALFSLGRICEMLSNRAHLAIVFLLAGIGGGLLSLIFLPDGSSVGASGAILGVIGYLVVYSFRRRQFISAEFRKSLLINIGFVLIYGLILSQRIDNFAHVGGLITGAVYGLIQIPADEYTDPREAGKLVSSFGMAAMAIWLCICLLSAAIIFSS